MEWSILCSLIQLIPFLWFILDMVLLINIMHWLHFELSFKWLVAFFYRYNLVLVVNVCLIYLFLLVFLLEWRELYEKWGGILDVRVKSILNYFFILGKPGIYVDPLLSQPLQINEFIHFRFRSLTLLRNFSCR